MKIYCNILLVVAVSGFLLDPATALGRGPDRSLGVALMSAMVDPAGNLIRGAGAVSAIRKQAGIYNITFSRSVVGCYLVVSASNTVPDAPPEGFAVGFTVSQSTDSLAVATYNTNSSLADMPFSALVYCTE